MNLVILESPFAGEVDINVKYARSCLRNSLYRGEAPSASHLLYTQPGVLDDTVPAERILGIDAGLSWRKASVGSVVYLDRGLSGGMIYGIQKAKDDGKKVVGRYQDPALLKALGIPTVPVDPVKLLELGIAIDFDPNSKLGGTVANNGAVSPELVILESPFAGEVELNVKYARAAMRDSLFRTEAPSVSHLLYTQDGVLDDTVPAERTMGIDAGLTWRAATTKSVVYLDRGLSGGMVYGIKKAQADGKKIEARFLDPKLLKDLGIPTVAIDPAKTAELGLDLDLARAA